MISPLLPNRINVQQKSHKAQLYALLEADRLSNVLSAHPWLTSFHSPVSQNSPFCLVHPVLQWGQNTIQGPTTAPRLGWSFCPRDRCH
jgi:hypothetical protein